MEIKVLNETEAFLPSNSSLSLEEYVEILHSLQPFSILSRYWTPLSKIPPEIDSATTITTPKATAASAATPTTMSTTTSPKLPSPSANIQSPQGNKLSSEREMIAFNTQAVINEINTKRKRDTSLVMGIISDSLTPRPFCAKPGGTRLG